MEALTADGTRRSDLTKDYDAFGNIVAKMNEVGPMSGVDAVNMLREYIDKTYGGYYGTTRSNLFCGYDACWDADEMVALLRCVVANPQTLNGTDSIQGLFSREREFQPAAADLFRLGGCSSVYAAMNPARIICISVRTATCMMPARVRNPMRLPPDARHGMEGLISADFMTKAATSSAKNYIPDDLGFMSYDYNQTQTILNTSLQEGEKYMAVMVPVALWLTVPKAVTT